MTTNFYYNLFFYLVTKSITRSHRNVNIEKSRANDIPMAAGDETAKETARSDIPTRSITAEVTTIATIKTSTARRRATAADIITSRDETDKKIHYRPRIR